MIRGRRLVTANLILCAALWYPLLSVFGATSSDQRLPEGSSYPWYDAEKDQFQRVELKPQDLLEERKDRWQSEHSASSATPTNSNAKGTTSLTASSLGADLLTVLIWLIIAVVLGIVGYLLAKTYFQDGVKLRLNNRNKKKSSENENDQMRVESLPFQVSPSRRNLFEEAQYWYEQRDYSKAMIYLYGYMLVELDRGHHIRLARGKTNRQYLREVRSRESLYGILKNAMIVFEDAFFGEQIITQERFEPLWRVLAEFQKQVTEAEPATT